MMRLLSVALVVGALALVGCGSSSHSSSGSAGGTSTAPTTTVHFAKTKFLLHAGLAFGAFHRYIYDPLKAGAFNSPLQHKLALVKAATAALFVVHEVKQASAAAQGSALLRKLFSPLTALAVGVTGAVAALRSGHVDTPAIESANSAIDSIKSTASSAGGSVTEHAPALP